MDLPHGAFAPVPTPLDASGNFDPGALGAHLEWLKAEGLDGALILGTNGEFPSLSQSERCEVARAAADSSLQKILCIGSSALPEVLALLEFGAELEYDAVLCPPPYYFRAAPIEGLAKFFRAVLDAAKLPVLLYHFPQIIGIPIGDELLDALGPHENLAGVKDSTGDPKELQRLLPRFADKGYFAGSDHLVSLCAESGGAGSITAAASVVPGLVAEVQKGRGSQFTLDKVRELLGAFGLSPAVKAILRARGFGDYSTRPPMLPLSPDRERELLSQLP